MADIIGICASARKNGNTAALLNKVLNATGHESELIFLSDLDIGFCSGCLSCRKNRGQCPKKDDMPLLLDKFLSAKAVVLGSPNYYYSVSGLMKNMIDRSIAWCYLGIGEHTGTEWHGWMPLPGKPIGFVVSQAAYGGEAALEALKCFAQWTGSKEAGSMIASVGAQPVSDFPEYLEEAKRLGEILGDEIQDKQFI